MKVVAALALLASATAFTAMPVRSVAPARSTVVFSEPEGELGKGGMADTRDPEPFTNEEDPRQSISAAPSFEEYLKSRAAEQGK